MLRLIITALFLVVFFIFSIPMFGILWIIGKFNKPKKDIIALRIVQWAFKVIRWLCGVKTTVIGYENIPKDEPVLYVGCKFTKDAILFQTNGIRNTIGFTLMMELRFCKSAVSSEQQWNIRIIITEFIKQGLQKIHNVC